MINLVLEHFDGVPVARPHGDIDAANASRLREELASCIAPNVDRVVLDLHNTRYIDSAGLDMLFRLSERLRQSRTRLLLVIPPSSQLNRLVEIVALDQTVAVRSSVEEALGSCLDRGS